MHIGARVPPFEYQDPWALDFEERLASFNAGKMRIAYFYEHPDTSTFRYRIFNMIDALNAAPELCVGASWFTRLDLPYLERFIDRADALVICRTRYEEKINRMVMRAKSRGIPVYFDIDDMVFDVEYAHLIMHTLNEGWSEDSWNYWFSYISRLGATLKLCDGVITTNQFLADRVAVFSHGMPTRIIPNYLNRAQQAESGRLFKAKINSRFASDNKIHLGYFSGSPTHKHDFEIVSEALAKLFDEDSRLILRIVGFLEKLGPLERHRHRVEFYPLQDFLNLQRLIAEVEINLSPLQDNVFTNCKSELKYFEAAVVGTLTIATPTFTFRKAIEDGENGFLAKAQEWKDKIETALTYADDADLYRTIIHRAHQHTIENYGWDRFGAYIYNQIFGEKSKSAIA
jgi:glycosyltransferase involved in cell wall biosynthesis